jgi:hypothetical protein
MLLVACSCYLLIHVAVVAQHDGRVSKANATDRTALIVITALLQQRFVQQQLLKLHSRMIIEV